MATDPVCGMQVDERTAAVSSAFEGRSYYFCSTGCKQKFEANPSAYVGARSRWQVTASTMRRRRHGAELGFRGHQRTAA